VDAFSSDAIPVHLLTKEAVEMYMSKLAPGGVLCVHVSNRHLNLVPVVADIAAAARVPKYDPKHWGQYERDENGQIVMTNLASRRGRDNAPGSRASGGREGLERREHIGHTTSEWVMVARDRDDLNYLDEPADYDALRKELQARNPNVQPDTTPYWSTPSSTGRHVWTDDYSNLLSVFRWPWSRRSED